MYPGAHAVLMDLVWPATTTTKSPRRRGGSRHGRKAVVLGSELDAAITAAHLQPLQQPPSTPTQQGAALILSRLKEMGVRVTATQQPLVSTDLQIAPIADLIGVYTEKVPDDTLVIVEVKCGCTAGRNVSVSGDSSSRFREPFSALKDTWKNRAHAQLALQCACAKLWAPHYRRVVGFLACYNPDNGTLKMAPLSKTVNAQLVPRLVHILRKLHKGCWRANAP